ncbi:pentapeptide repeat-containing protein [Adhaeribacter rhizoryzae]|uniref:pentapeptide repeat-containing protein n=1 Tax=Adhaeribacter rhizoryzae TaxID=2607907 RepID=UPI001CC1CAE8|nr:pentapeptide repeat-containing protein [Adhaeribacter rhizoryzae]
MKKLWEREDKEININDTLVDNKPLLVDMSMLQESDEEDRINNAIRASKTPLRDTLQLLWESDEKEIKMNTTWTNESQCKLILDGVEGWNNWRRKNPKVKVNLEGADLRGANLEGAELGKAKLSRACLRGANLREAKLGEADLGEADLSDANLQRAWVQKGSLHNAKFYRANLNEANLSGSIITGADLRNTNLRDADLRDADLSDASCSDADLSGALLTGADLSRAALYEANLRKANFYGADLSNASLAGACFIEANLHEANLHETNCYRTDFSYANLTSANLQNAVLVETNLEQAILTNSKIYGLSAWALKGAPKAQSSLIITPNEEAAITVDDLKLAQFIYMLLNNENVRNVIDTITSKAVLILGRFTPDRKNVLDLIRQELNKYNYVPILFDFANTQNQTLLETVLTLAGMSRFIIADVTDATMVREELRSIVEKYPSKPIQPILLHTEKEYVTLLEISIGFKSLLKIYTYKDQDEVVSNLEQNIIHPAEAWIEAREGQMLGTFKTAREIELERENEALKKKLEEKEEQ